MDYKKISKNYRKLFGSTFSKSNVKNNVKYGVIYTLYSGKMNFLEVGFAENETNLENKLLNKEYILVDKRNGTMRELNLLVETLSEFGIKYSRNFNFKYSNISIRHLSTLGWPIGRSLYKQRYIKKKLSYA